jgi:hypothetical protein
MALCLAIGRSWGHSHGKEGVSGSSPDVGLALEGLRWREDWGHRER